MINTEIAQYKKYNPETLTEAKIFEIYYAIGDSRNKAKLLPLARKIDDKISADRITRMKIRLFWEQRIKARDYNLIVTMQSSAIHNIDDLKLTFYNALKNNIKDSFVTNDKGETAFDLKIFNFNDLEKSIKLLLLLAGEATDISMVKVEIVNTVIQNIINVVSLHVKDPKIVSQIAIELNKVVERS